jgi:ABC-type antimicrobial peptide transport system permease subunit
VRVLDPDVPVFDVTSLDDALAWQRWPYRVFGGMFAVCAAFALVLSMVGLYAVTACSVAQRTQEIGVRIALGAQLWQVVWLIARRAAIQLALGVVIGTVGAVLVGRALSSVLVGTGSTDVAVLGVLILILTLTALIAVLVPSRRAARLHPTIALAAD